MIRVLLVDDSPVALHILQRLLSRAADIQVAGTAANGQEALALLPVLQPDVICTDLHMPVMDGLELTRMVMALHPLPILVVSVSVEAGSHNVFSLLEAGAVDIFAKPADILAADQERLAKELISKIRIVAGVHVFRRNSHAPVVRTAVLSDAVTIPEVHTRMVVIGASTGGPQALHDILSRLPGSFPLPVVCVQHIGSGFIAELVSWLDEACPMKVCQAVHGERVQPGFVYFAPGDVHLEMEEGRFVHSAAALFDGHRPSVTVTMNAAARCYGAATVGVLLTGMGTDGAEGMASIAAAGGMTIAQNEESCVVYGMPKAAVARGAVKFILPLEQIAPALMKTADFGVLNNE